MSDNLYKEAISDWINDSLHIGLFTTDSEFNIKTWNRWLEIHSGIPLLDAINTNIFHLFPELKERKIERYYYQVLEGQTALLSQRFHKYLLPLSVQDECRTYFDRMQQTAQIAPLLSGNKVIGTITRIEDVTERVVKEMALRREIEVARKAEMMVKKERDLAQHYLDIAGVMLLVLDANGNISLINKKGCEILGYSYEDIIGKNWFETCLPEEKSERVKNAFKDIIKGNAEPYKNAENLVKTSSGELKTIYWHNTTLKDEDGNITGTLSSGEDITERKRLENALKTMSITDELTGIYNRRGFFTISQRQLKIAERAKNNMLLFFIDLDDMKKINDTLGHQWGDKALVRTADILRETFRESDILARVGGDEFAVLAIDITGTSVDVIYDRIKEKTEKFNRKDALEKLRISLSIGYSRYNPEKPKTLDELIAEADNMMYEAKRAKNRREVKG